MGWKDFRHEKRGSREEGQALIEFVLGLLIVISFFFFYVKMAAVFAIGNYIHYATFMAARAYSSSAQTEEQQKSNAERVLSSMVSNRWKAVIRPKGGNSSTTGATVGPGPYATDNAAEDTWNQGVMFEYTAKLSLYPWSRDSQSILVDLTSESWMPREESLQECLDKRSAAKSEIVGKARAEGLEWDNGC